MRPPPPDPSAISCRACRLQKPAMGSESRDVWEESSRTGGQISWRGWGSWGSLSGLAGLRKSRRKGLGLSYSRGRTSYRKATVQICADCLAAERRSASRRRAFALAALAAGAAWLLL